MEDIEHRDIHEELHKKLDELISDFILITEKLPSQVTLLEFMEWSFMQTITPPQKRNKES